MEDPSSLISYKQNEFDMKRFELYLRTILICKYYTNLF